MRSFQVCRCGEPMQFAETATPKPKGSEVVLKVLAAGVCHSDLHIWEGFYDLGGGKVLQLQDRGVKLPLTMGHENVGEVVAVGPRAPASRSATTAGLSVDRLRQLRGVQARRRTALHGAALSRRLSRRRLCHASDGAASRYLVAYPKAMKPEQAAPLACSGVTAYGALKKLGSVVKREPVVIFGAGGLGLICIAFVKAMKGKGVIAVDIDPVKREAAKRQGALATVDPNAPDALAQIQKAAKGPVWAAIDFVGNEQTARLGVDSLVKGGKLIVVGLFGGDITLSLPFIPIRAMTIQGSYTGSLKELNELIALVREAPLPLVPTKTSALDGAQRVIIASRPVR